MIIIDINESQKEICIPAQSFSEAGNTAILEIKMVDGDANYDLTGKKITANFSKPGVETKTLDSINGIIRLPIMSKYASSGQNTVRLNFEWDTNQLEQSPVILWYIGGKIPLGEILPDILSANEVTVADGTTVEERISKLNNDLFGFGRQLKFDKGTTIYQPVLADVFTTNATNPTTLTATNDSTLVMGGDTSLKLTVSAAANTQYHAYLKSNIKIIDNTKPLQIWIHIPVENYSKIMTISCQVGIDYKYTEYAPDVVYSIVQTAIEYKRVGWNMFTINVSSVPNNTILKYLHFGIKCNAICTPIIRIGAFRQGYKITSPKIVFTFDNCATNLYTNVYPILKEYGYKGTFAWQTGSLPGNAGILTVAQYKELLTAGWDYAMYTSTANMATYQTSLKAVGLDPRFLFCPNNASSETIITTLKSLNFLMCRNRWWDDPYLLYADNTTFEITCNGLQDNAYTTLGQHLSDDISLVDRAIANGGIVCICIHQVLPTAGSDGLSTQDTTLRAFLNYVKTKSDLGQIEVITFGQLYDSIYSDSCPTYPSTIGDRKYSDNPLTSGFIGWVYTKNGWKGFGAIS